MAAAARSAGLTGSLALGALGIVFGDIGTSPLYALKAVFALGGGVVQPTTENVFGVVSLVFWSITLVVSGKYLGFILRADNDGEGGVMALAHLVRRSPDIPPVLLRGVLLLGAFGGSLFFGDALITPAISVLSAVEGLQVAAPGMSHLVVPLSVGIIVALFSVQRLGTHHVSRFFGPVMLVWFLTIGTLGAVHVLADPAVLVALSPHHAVLFVVAHPGVAFVAMGAIVLVITGAEALYADMGHFGRVPIIWSWFVLVFPCLTLNYLGQAQLILRDRHEIANPFFHLAPMWAQLPLVVLATMATIIASQAVISGAFSVARQAERLGLLPRLSVRQTSQVQSGQIYIGAVNWLLLAGVLVLLLTFRASERLATAYGVAVTTDLLLTTILFCLYALWVRGWRRWQVALFAVVFGHVELAYFAANIVKVQHGGWLPLAVALALATLMTTWSRGRELVTARREKIEGPLLPFLDEVHQTAKILRVPGTAVFLHRNKETTPLALRDNVRFNHVIHDSVFIVTVDMTAVPHVPEEQRAVLDELGDPYDHVAHITVRFGFADEPDVPAALRVARDEGIDIDLGHATYFLSRINLQPTDRPGMGAVRKRLFVLLARNSADPTHYFALPVARTVVGGAVINF